MKVVFDTYTIYARFFPALISAFPLLILWFFLSPISEMQGLMKYVFSLRFFGSLTLGVVFLYFFSQLTRTTSKVLERKYFIDSKGFPTTYLVMYSDETLSKSYKDAFRKRVSEIFNVHLPTQIQESDDFHDAKKRITEITKQIILHVGAGKLVQKHNIWYGFFRNLLGGFYFSIISCLLNIGLGFYWLENSTLWIFSAVLLACYGGTLIFQRSILTQHAEAYAKQLISEFMAQ